MAKKAVYIMGNKSYDILKTPLKHTGTKTAKAIPSAVTCLRE
jgi:hypothetical protein